jgi:DNA polymerase-3 subunit alpha
MDQDGYRNLTQLTTRSWSEGFYRWPTVESHMLADHADGLIALSGCADSHLACTLLGGKGIEKGSKKAAERLLQTYLRMFGDRYYLEVQRFPDLERTCELNSQYGEWSERYGIPLAATADVHYPLPEQSDIQRVLHSQTVRSFGICATLA